MIVNHACRSHGCLFTLGEGDWTPLKVFGRDNRHISVTRPGRIEEVTVLPSGETVKTTKDVTASYYANPMNPGSVFADDIREAFFKEEMYKDFLEEGSIDADILGALTEGIQVEPRDIITGWIHAAAASNHRALLENVVRGKVGYLAGSKYSHICSGMFHLQPRAALCVYVVADFS
jgi:hypothetical protein